MHKNWQSENRDLQNQQLIPVTVVDSDYTIFDALHTQTAMSTNSLHIINQM